MRKIMLALALGGAAISFGSVQANASYDYPYCFVSRSTGSPGDCAYTSYAQCMAAASGRGGYCNINPRYAFARQGYNPGSGYNQGYVVEEPVYVAPRRRYRQYYAPY